MKKAYLVKIGGRVTGVGFRFSTVEKAREYPSLCGYVRNVGYGEVEALIQGETDEIEQMLLWLRHGPSWARVDEFNLNEVPVSESYRGFEIR